MDQTVKQSHIWKRDENDYYIEPEWCSKRLFETEFFCGTIHDPACGSGRIVRSAQGFGYQASGSDIVCRSSQCSTLEDFIQSTKRHDNIASNPPFKHAEAFVRHALDVTEDKVAMLLPLTWLTGKDRSKFLESTPLYRVYILAPRPSMPPGAVIEAGEKPGGGTKDFAWFVWSKGFDGEPAIHFLRRDG